MTAYPPRPWLVTLVCGASGVGKSRVAIPLARHYRVPLAEADDVVTALTALSTPEQQPLLHRWTTDPTISTWTPEQIVAHTIAVAQGLRRGFEAVITDHIEAGTPVVLEGDFLLPDLVTGFRESARAVVIAETDENRIVANYLAREPSEGPQRQRARVSALFGAELSGRADRVGVPVVPAWPWSDGLDRVDAALRRT